MAEENEAEISGEKATREGALRDRVARRAYELYEQRGGVDGFDTEDWLRAEQEILGRAEQADTPAAEGAESEGQPEVGAKAAGQT